MLVFGVDIPLVEIQLVMAVILFILLIEAIIIVAFLNKYVSKTKEMAAYMEHVCNSMQISEKATKKQK